MAAVPQNQIIFQWLERIGLGHAIAMFQSQGITSPQALMELTFEKYDALGVFDANERKRLSELVTRVQEAAKRSRPTTAQPVAPVATTPDAADEGAPDVGRVARQHAQPSRMSIMPHLAAGSVRAVYEPGGGSGGFGDYGDAGTDTGISATIHGGPAAAPVVAPSSGVTTAAVLLPRRAGGYDRDGFESRPQRRWAPPPPTVSHACISEHGAAPAGGGAEGEAARSDSIGDNDTAAGGSSFEADSGSPALELQQQQQQQQLDGDHPAALSSTPAQPPLPPTRRPLAVGVMPSARAAMAKRQSMAKPGDVGAPVLPSAAAASGLSTIPEQLPEPAKRPKSQPPLPYAAAAAAPTSPPGIRPFAGLPRSGLHAPPAVALPAPFRSVAAAAGKDATPGQQAVPGGGSERSDWQDQKQQQHQYRVDAGTGAAAPAQVITRMPSAASLSWGLGSGAFDSGGPRIRVVVRKRPMSRRELRANELDTVQAVSRRTVLVHEPRQKVDLTRYTETFEFTFDEVFDETVSTEDVYRYTAQPLVGSIFRGGNATCFAYGQTGSGKTYTMMGDLKNLAAATSDDARETERASPGLYVLAARDIFTMLRSWEARHGSSGGLDKAGTPRLAVLASFFEIYANKLFDLGNGRKELKAMVDHRQEVQVVGVSEHLAPTVEALLKLIDKGNAERMTGSTGANADSSRSHAILNITLAHAVADGRGGIVVKTDTKTGRAKVQGKFSFIDLAGSERGADHLPGQDRRTRQEGAEINKSLLALKECIRSLYQEAEYNPFRGSKLTQVLKDSFVGDSRTVMIATISPGMASCEHTLNTLRYGYRVKEIRHDDGVDVPYEPPHGSGGQRGPASDAEINSFLAVQLARNASAARAAAAAAAAVATAPQVPVLRPSTAGGTTSDEDYDDRGRDGTTVAAAVRPPLSSANAARRSSIGAFGDDVASAVGATASGAGSVPPRAKRNSLSAGGAASAAAAAARRGLAAAASSAGAAARQSMGGPLASASRAPPISARSGGSASGTSVSLGGAAPAAPHPEAHPPLSRASSTGAVPPSGVAHSLHVPAGNNSSDPLKGGEFTGGDERPGEQATAIPRHSRVQSAGGAGSVARVPYNSRARTLIAANVGGATAASGRSSDATASVPQADGPGSFFEAAIVSPDDDVRRHRSAGLFAQHAALLQRSAGAASESSVAQAAVADTSPSVVHVHLGQFSRAGKGGDTATAATPVSSLSSLPQSEAKHAWADAVSAAAASAAPADSGDEGTGGGLIEQPTAAPPEVHYHRYTGENEDDEDDGGGDGLLDGTDDEAGDEGGDELDDVDPEYEVDTTPYRSGGRDAPDSGSRNGGSGDDSAASAHPPAAMRRPVADDDSPIPPPPPQRPSLDAAAAAYVDVQFVARAPKAKTPSSARSSAGSSAVAAPAQDIDPAIKRARDAQERMRSVSLALAGVPLISEERRLVQQHRELMEEMQGLLRDEWRMVEGSLGADSPPGGGSSPVRSLTRGDMAQYTLALLDVLNRKLVAVTGLLSAVERYQVVHGAEVGLSVASVADDAIGVQAEDDDEEPGVNAGEERRKGEGQGSGVSSGVASSGGTSAAPAAGGARPAAARAASYPAHLASSDPGLFGGGLGAGSAPLVPVGGAAAGWGGPKADARRPQPPFDHRTAGPSPQAGISTAKPPDLS